MAAFGQLLHPSASLEKQKLAMSIANGPHVVIIGAGVGGIAMAITLLKKHNFSNFTIVERASSAGGTWRDNSYPGCACDIPVHWYSLSTELNPDWKQQFATQGDILKYWEGIFYKYNLARYTKFNTEMLQSVWNEEKQLWSVSIAKKTETKAVETSIIEANAVVSATGLFSIPFYANITGRERFKGIQFHSSRWDHSVDLRGKKVGVIGNGCSATQFIPKISEDPTVQVVNVCRSASWFMPRDQFSYFSIVRWIFRYIPGVGRLYRYFVVVFSDSRSFVWDKNFGFIRKLVECLVLFYMRLKAPKRHHKNLTPDYPMGCKRIILDPGYYSSLQRPNVDLAWGGVQEILEDGLLTGKGQKFQFDVIIYGTGFQAAEPDMKVTGRNGQTLTDFFKSRGGAEAYVSTTYPGFPNYFTLLGPNLATGHTSALFGEEMQINYISQLLKPVLDGSVKSYEVKVKVSDKFNAGVQKKLSGMTFTECRTYYQNATGKNTVTFPGGAFGIWRMLRSVNFEDYLCVVAEGEGSGSRNKKVV